MLDGRWSPILKKDEVTPYRSACMRLSFLAKDRLDLAETAKHLAQRMSEPREFDFVPFETCSAMSGGKVQSGADLSNTETLKLTRSHNDIAGDPVTRKSTTGLVAQMGHHTVKSGSRA